MAIEYKKKDSSDDDKPEILAPEGAPARPSNYIDPLEQSDSFVQAADRSAVWMQNNQGLVLGGIAALIVAIIAVVFFQGQSSNAEQERSAVLTEAIETVRGTVDNPDQKLPPNAPTPSSIVYKTEKEKFEAMYKEADEVIQKYGKESVARGAKLIKARAAMKIGKADESVTLFKEWLEKNPSAVEKPFVLFGLSSAQAEAGKPADAVATLKSLKDLGETYAESASLQIARVYDAAGQKEKARSEYNSFLKAYPKSEQLELVKLRLDLL